MQKPTPEQRKELGSFLASRRARLQPNEVGLPNGRRRTPGLRREEVAVLAGVSVSWYTWLEQGRDIQASARTLRQISNVLQLSAAESSYLFALSSLEPPFNVGNDRLSDGLTLLVQALDPIPAYIRNPRTDILAWNAAVADLFVDYGSLQPHERNTLRLMFLHPRYRTLILGWEQMARGYMSSFRAARARAHDKAPFDRLIEELTSSSREFRDWWPDSGVTNFEEGTKSLQHPTIGRVDYTYVALAPEGHPDLSMVAYILRKGSGE